MFYSSYLLQVIFNHVKCYVLKFYNIAKGYQTNSGTSTKI